MPCQICQDNYIIKPCKTNLDFIENYKVVDKTIGNSTLDFAEELYRILMVKCPCIDCLVKMSCIPPSVFSCEKYLNIELLASNRVFIKLQDNGIKKIKEKFRS
jgi:hypothetical protein